MTHKQKCIEHCKYYLKSRNLSHVFDFSNFKHYYRKHNGASGNAFLTGLNAADFMILNFQPNKKEVYYVTRNES